jgi:hypothetical protein
MGEAHQKNSPGPILIAPVFWAWAQQHAAPEEPLHLTRLRAIQMQAQANAKSSTIFSKLLRTGPVGKRRRVACGVKVEVG